MSKIEFKLSDTFRPGLGYSPAAAGPVGGWSYTPGPGFFDKQPMNSILPRLTGPGSKPTNGHFFGKGRKGRRRSFGYPLMNTPSSEINMQMFPRYPVGPGNTPGGLNGSTWFPSLPGINQYWGFGNKRKSKKTRKPKRKSKKTRRPKRKSRKSRRRSKSRK